MTQLFRKDFGFLFRLGVLGVFATAMVAVFLWRAVMAYPAGVNEPLEQPVPFSHKHHVTDEGIDCRYCHSSVETSAFAGMPPLSTCMTCHSQLFTDQPALAPLISAFQSDVSLRWQRVHDLPDFVYFNHSIHIAKGVGCASCHGQVDQMPLTWRVAPLTMQWCLDCHRSPEQYLRPRDQVFNLRWQAKDQRALGAQLLLTYHIDKRRLTECSVCHR
ncbi:MAG TPA: cytochrome c3 family protein [Steroidobacteraceae bacterium]|nr:cytochrome c3 family protein [Steroidobacteraceae bacterium]